MVHPEWDLSSAKARDFAVNLDKLHEELQLQIAEAQKCYQGPADARQTPAPDFKVGDSLHQSHTFSHYLTFKEVIEKELRLDLHPTSTITPTPALNSDQY